MKRVADLAGERQERLTAFAHALRSALDYMPSGYKGASDDRTAFVAPVEAVIARLEGEARMSPPLEARAIAEAAREGRFDRR